MSVECIDVIMYSYLLETLFLAAYLFPPLCQLPFAMHEDFLNSVVSRAELDQEEEQFVDQEKWGFVSAELHVPHIALIQIYI